MSKLYRFFLVITPGLEEFAWQELLEKDTAMQLQFSSPPLTEIESIEGGIEFSTTLAEALRLQRYLKIPSRVLLRLGQFRAFEFPQLLKQLAKVDWSMYQGQVPLEYSIASQRSRLGQEKRIEKVFREFFLKKFKMESGQGPALYVRVFRDVFHLSLDLSGEHLHFRGYRKEQGTAPLRENFAAALVHLLLQDLSRQELGQLCLLDPYMGSGTLLAEAHNFDSALPLSLRRFSGDELQRDKQKLPLTLAQDGLWHELLGVEMDQDLVRKASQNLKLAGLPQHKIRLLAGDNQKLELRQLVEGRRLRIVSNPPYGDRLAGSPQKILQDCRELIEKLRPEKALFLVPQQWKGLPIDGYSISYPLRFSNNGIPVVGLLYNLS